MLFLQNVEHKKVNIIN